MPLTIALIVLVVIVFFIYNGLVRLKVAADGALSRCS
jgi:hypothetical protein